MWCNGRPCRFRKRVVAIVGMGLLGLGGPGARAQDADAEAPVSPPVRVTSQTQADPAALQRLQEPGEVLFEDGFESAESLRNYFEVQGSKEGHARVALDPALAHSGQGSLQLTAVSRDGKESGVWATAWLGAKGRDRVSFRRYIKFADDYDQGNLHHVGGGLTGVAGDDRYRGMGTAGRRPRGDDYFKSAFEPWSEWKTIPPPGRMFLYTYWMDMAIDRATGRYYGNMLSPEKADAVRLGRGRWYCLEHMIQANTVGQADGELAAWIDGKLYLHFKGIRWRSSPEVLLKRIDLTLYVHSATKDNTVWYDDVVVSSGYVGPLEEGPSQSRP